LAGRTALRAGGTVLSGVSAKGGSLDKIGKFANTWGGELRDSRLKEKRDARIKTLKKFGFGDKTFEAADTVMKDKNIQTAGKVIKGSAMMAAGVMTGAPVWYWGSCSWWCLMNSSFMGESFAAGVDISIRLVLNVFLNFRMREMKLLKRQGQADTRL
jgi:hypothetical protein